MKKINSWAIITNHSLFAELSALANVPGWASAIAKTAVNAKKARKKLKESRRRSFKKGTALVHLEKS